MMNSMPVELNSVGISMAEIESLRNRFDIYDFLKRLALSYDYRFFAVMTLPSETDEKIARCLEIANWPEAFVRDFDAARLLSASPTFAQLRRSVRPVPWDAKTAFGSRGDGKQAEAVLLAALHGFANGIYFPVHDRTGKRGICGFAGDRQWPDFNEMAELSLICNQVYDRLSEIGGAQTVSGGARLSARERECLVWTAAGKTSQDIATILSLSEHTVNQYITSACQKLGAVNRAQAVAVAVRSKIVD